MTRDISNSEDVLDSRDIIERIEDLESSRLNWAAGWNMPGYMPDSEPARFESFDDARDYIAGQMDDTAEIADDGVDVSDITAAAARWRKIETESDHGETVGDYHYWIQALAGAECFDDPDDAKEYDSLKALAAEGAGYPDWPYGATLVRDSYFKEYAMELADELGAIPKDATWPNTCIDWDQAARELQMDYGSVEYDGVTYWIR